MESVLTIDGLSLSFSSSINGKRRKRKFWLGYIFAFLCALVSAASYAMVALYSDDTIKTVLLRGTFQYFCVLPVMQYRKVDLCKLNLKVTGRVLFRGCIFLICVFTFNMSLNYISVGNATAIIYSYPVLVVVLARVFLKEKFGLLQVLCTFMTFVGILLVSEPSFIFGKKDEEEFKTAEALRMLGILLSFIAAVSSALDCVLLRQITQQVDFSITMFYSSIESIIASWIYLAVTKQLSISCLYDLPYAFGAAFLAITGQLLYILALQRVKAGPVSVLSTTQVLFAFLFQFILFQSFPTLCGGIGAALIFLCTVVTTLQNIFKK